MDHKIATWRFRHVQMVEKMLGKKLGNWRKFRTRISKTNSR